MRITIVLLTAIFIVAGCTKSPPENTNKQSISIANASEANAMAQESARLNAWFDETHEQETMRSPINLAYLGRVERKGELDDFSSQRFDADIARITKRIATLTNTFDYELLDDATKISYDFWLYNAQQILAADKFRNNAYVFEQMNAMHSFFVQFMISIHTVENVQDAQDYLSRVSAIAVSIDQLIANSKSIAKGGVRPPYFAFEAVINESTKIISGAPFDNAAENAADSAIWADAQSKITALVEQDLITQNKADELTANIKQALISDFKPAYERLIAWQKQDQVNATEQAQGVSALPMGDAYYNERLANQTTTTLTANEIHNIGLSEVARLRSEMELVKDEFGFDGTLQAFFMFLRDTKDDQRLYYPNTDEGRQGYIDDATAAIKKIEAVLPDYFGILPKADMVVKRVEAFREQDGAAQHYSPSTPDGSRPGTYYAHLSDMTAMPKRELEVIAYHEGLPGHHMQIAISLELENIPTFRKQTYLNAYGEGWALYSEWLAKEMPGTYTDPLSEFGRLGSEIWRAVRLVVDTGLHSKGWTEEMAITYFKENSAITNEQALSEVQRYLVLPGQATGYKIGMIKIQDLRANAEMQLGDDFDIRAFHDTVLGGGALPLTILERRVNEWIASVKGSVKTSVKKV